MASVSFSIGDSRVRVYTTKVKRPNGLAGVCWNGDNNVHVNIKVNAKVSSKIGGVSVIKGGYYWAIASNDLWRHKNTAHTPVESFELAFDALVSYVKDEIERTIFINAADLYNDAAESNLGIEE